MSERESSALLPRLVVAGLAGDTGKTLVTLGLIGALRARGFRVAPFKKGPDFIDAAWLGCAAGRSGRNLDTFLMSESAVLNSLTRAAGLTDVAVVEGNRGLFDGLDADGSHSTARLAHLTGAPTVLVIDATKATRTIAALVLGCQSLDPELELAGVILNRVATARQEKVIRQAVAEATRIPVLGSIPKLREQNLPSRHLGLLTAVEHAEREEVLQRLASLVEQHAAVSELLDIARRAAPLQCAAPERRVPARPVVRVGILQDQAFSFYYPENLEALEQVGAELVTVSPLEDDQLPELDALYAGGGFPEVHAARLSDNLPFRALLADRIAEGLPVWAECGGLGYLAKAWEDGATSYPMVGALPITVRQQSRPQGHGYVIAHVDRQNPFLPEGAELRGHEFHYSSLATDPSAVTTALRLERGVGVGAGRDGIVSGNVIATYTHLHALGTPAWAESLVEVARRGSAARPNATRTRARLPLAVLPSSVRSPAPQQAGRKGSNQTLRRRARNRAEEVRDAAHTLGPARKSPRDHLSTTVRSVVERANVSELEELGATEPRAVRYLLGLTYQADPTLRKTAAHGVALASRYHPRLVQNVVRRLVWAMNDESGTNAATAPEVIQAIAETNPELLLPMVPDLVRLAADEELRDGLAAALRTVAQKCPGRVGSGLGAALSKRTSEGGACGCK